jgi:hypothetical protein
VFPLFFGCFQSIPLSGSAVLSLEVALMSGFALHFCYLSSFGRASPGGELVLSGLVILEFDGAKFVLVFVIYLKIGVLLIAEIILEVFEEVISLSLLQSVDVLNEVEKAFLELGVRTNQLEEGAWLVVDNVTHSVIKFTIVR